MDALSGQSYFGNLGGTPTPTLTPSASKPYEVFISPLDFGFHVRVGCKTFAMSSAEDLISKLAMYLKDPAATQKKFEAGELFKIAL